MLGEHWGRESTSVLWLWDRGLGGEKLASKFPKYSEWAWILAS